MVDEPAMVWPFFMGTMMIRHWTWGPDSLENDETCLQDIPRLSRLFLASSSLEQVDTAKKLVFQKIQKS